MDDDTTNRQSDGKARTGSDGTGQEQPILTTWQGHPVTDNQNVRTVGNRGPTTLENYQFIEKVTHFDRERIPERVVHARGPGAHGYFEAYGTIGDQPASTLGRNCFRRRASEPRCSYASPRSSTAVTHRRRCATRAASL